MHSTKLVPKGCVKGHIYPHERKKRGDMRMIFDIYISSHLISQTD